MKLSFIVLLNFLLCVVAAESSELELQEFFTGQCNADAEQFNFTSVSPIELNRDTNPEYAALHSGNNFREYYYFSVEACGYSVIENSMGKPLVSLSDSGSFSCAPHGCFAVVSCSGGAGLSFISILEMSGSGHSGILMAGQEPKNYDFSSELTETMYLYNEGVVEILWQETKLYSESAIEELRSLRKVQGCV